MISYRPVRKSGGREIHAQVTEAVTVGRWSRRVGELVCVAYWVGTYDYAWAATRGRQGRWRTVELMHPKSVVTCPACRRRLEAVG